MSQRLRVALLSAVLLGAAGLVSCGSSNHDQTETQSTATPERTDAPQATDAPQTSPSPESSSAPLCAEHGGVKTGPGTLVNPSDGKKVTIIVVCSDDSVDYQEIEVYQ